MNRILSMGVALAIAATIPAPTSLAGDGPLKVVVHVNFPETGTQGAGLRSIGNILKEEPEARIEVVCHAAGIGLVEKARSEHAEAVEALIKNGVAAARPCSSTSASDPNGTPDT